MNDDVGPSNGCGTKMGLLSSKGGGPMRSDLVFAAKVILPNRYTLCWVVSSATRRFHRPNTRIEETTDAVLLHIADSGAETVGARHEQYFQYARSIASRPEPLHSPNQRLKRIALNLFLLRPPLIRPHLSTAHEQTPVTNWCNVCGTEIY